MRVGKLTSLRSSERVQVFQPGLQVEDECKPDKDGVYK